MFWACSGWLLAIVRHLRKMGCILHVTHVEYLNAGLLVSKELAKAVHVIKVTRVMSVLQRSLHVPTHLNNICMSAGLFLFDAVRLQAIMGQELSRHNS